MQVKRFVIQQVKISESKFKQEEQGDAVMRKTLRHY
jgi:hypothetical protein